MNVSARLTFVAVGCERGGAVLFRGLSFDIGPGDAMLVTGPNGTGKSSLIRIAAGLLKPAVGAVTRDGTIGLLGETSALDAEQTLADALSFWAALDCSSAAIDEAMVAMALQPVATVPVRMLSTGQRRRAAMARVIAARAALWLLDEPANGLDAASLLLLEQAIVAHRAGGGAVLVASHVPMNLPGAQMLTLGR